MASFIARLFGTPEDVVEQGVEVPVQNESEVFFQSPDIEDDGTHARWADEVVTEFGQTFAKLLARNRVVQFVVAATVVVDVFISLYTVIEDRDEEDMSISVMAVVILCVLVFDIIIRLVAHRLSFFLGGINVLELVIVILCLIEMIMRNIFPINSSIGRLFRPLARGLKITSSALKVLGAKRRVNMRVDQLADSVTDDLLDQALGDVIYISPENATAQPTEGRFRIEKTHFLPNAFADLHAPVTIKGGFIELIYIDADLKAPTWKIPWGSGKENQGFASCSNMDLGAVDGGQGLKSRVSKISNRVANRFRERRKQQKKKHGSGVVVVCKNVLLVVGPGHHDNASGMMLNSWDFEEVVRYKDRLVELFASRVELLLGKKKKKKEPADGSLPKKKPPVSGVMGFMGQIRDAIFTGAGRFANIKHVSIDVLNVEIRYEDFDILPRPDLAAAGPASSLMAQLSLGGSMKGSRMPISIGFKVGEFHLRLEGGPTSPLDHHLFRAHAVWHHAPPQLEEQEEPPKHDPFLSHSQSFLSLGESSKEKPPLRLAIRLVRVSSWLDHDVHRSACFTPFFNVKHQSPIRITPAVKLFRRLQCLERLKLAAIAAVEQQASKDADEEGKDAVVTAVSARTCASSQPKKTKLRMQRLQEMILPHQYILSPAVVSVHMLSLEPPEPEGKEPPPRKKFLMPGPAREASKVGSGEANSHCWSRPGHSIDCEVPKLNFQFDPWQARALMLLNDYVAQWVQHDMALSRRPIIRPGQLPIHHAKSMGQSTDLDDEVEHHRRQVIRSWWVYAVHAVAYIISPNGKLETFLELRRRARCRGVYIASLLTKLRSEHLHKMTWSHQPRSPTALFSKTDSETTSMVSSHQVVRKNLQSLRLSVGVEEGLNGPSTGGSSPTGNLRRQFSGATNNQLLQLMDAAEKRPQDFVWNNDTEKALLEMQVTLPFQDILLARLVAKQRHEDEKHGGVLETLEEELLKLEHAKHVGNSNTPPRVIHVDESVDASTAASNPKAETSQISLRVGAVAMAFLDPPKNDAGVKLRRQQVRAFIHKISIVFEQGSPASEWERLTQRPAGVVNRGKFGAPVSDEAVFNALPGLSEPPVTEANAATSGWIGVELLVGAFGVLYVQAPQDVPSLRVVLQCPPPPKGPQNAPSASSSEPVALETTPLPVIPVHQLDCADDHRHAHAPMVVVRFLSWHDDPSAQDGLDVPQEEPVEGSREWSPPPVNVLPQVRKHILLAFVCPLEVISYKPLVNMVVMSILGPLKVPEADHLDLLSARRNLQQQRAARTGIKKMNQAFETVTGFKLGSSADNNSGTRFVISMGAIRATTVEQFTATRMLIQRVELPASTEAFSSNEVPPAFDVGLRFQSVAAVARLSADCFHPRPVEVASIQVAVEDESVEVDQSGPAFAALPLSPRTMKDSPFKWMSSVFATSCAKLPTSCAEVSACTNDKAPRTRSTDEAAPSVGKSATAAVSETNSMTEIPLQSVPGSPRAVATPWLDSKAVSVRIKSVNFRMLERELLQLAKLSDAAAAGLAREQTKDSTPERDKHVAV